MRARVGEYKLAYFRQHVLPIVALSDPCHSHLVHPACPVGPKDRTGVNPVKCIELSSSVRARLRGSAVKCFSP